MDDDRRSDTWEKWLDLLHVKARQEDMKLGYKDAISGHGPHVKLLDALSLAPSQDQALDNLAEILLVPYFDLYLYGDPDGGFDG